LDIREEAPTPAALSEHAAIPIAFVVDRVLEVRLGDGGLGGMSLTQTVVTDPYVKDYDALEGAGPQCWPGRFDVSNWTLIGARRDGACVGGAVIATRTPGLHMLGGRDDVAVLWDIRVSPRERRGGIGSALFRAAEDWAGARSFRCSRSRLRTSTFRPATSTQDGLHPGRHRPVRLSQSASLGAAAVVEGPGTVRHELQLTNPGWLSKPIPLMPNSGRRDPYSYAPTCISAW
jgi:GNAT superfamily N-acetyltransferase